ncbi:hypothetical protein C8F04DRAFT_1089774 [Mycena alexandri]|uniref:Uncharacterized protein n=1 Tax=Mycena alexandri TaxID=1745969 RepID=A0AAD6X3Z7_9AGAR|nr:hypothetical protein C8F04DRAFT_1089774 [Mycena alexandri]
MWMHGLLTLLSGASGASGASAGPSGSATASAQVTVITSLTTSIGFAVSGGNRQETTSVGTILITSTIQPTTPAPPPISNSASSSAPTSTSTANLPTGTVSMVTDEAPSPGATGGAYGPPDSFINAAYSLARNTVLLGTFTALVGFLVI